MVDISSVMLSGVSDVVAKFIEWIYNGVGNYAVAVILFTLILKVALSPLDVWQKIALRKNNKAMERLKPKLEKLQKQCGGNKELYAQKQMQLYKEEGYSMFGSCIPMIVTLVLFFVIFAGFRAEVKNVNVEMYSEMREAYYSTYDATGGDVDASKQAVIERFEKDYASRISFLWVNNIFMPDGWQDAIPSYDKFVSSGIGGVGATDPYKDQASITGDRYENAGETGYNEVMLALQEKYNNRWNGFLILPLLVVALSVVSSKLNKPMQAPTAGGNEQTEAAMKANMKVMQYMMPVMMGVFALFYSAAFTLYMFISSLFTTVFQLVYNLVAKRKDKKEEEQRLINTYK